MIFRLPIVILFIVACISGFCAELPEGFIEIIVADGLDPTALAEAPDGRIFIAEKHGRIRIVRDDTLLETTFLKLKVDNFNERGLLGLALHPNFTRNGYVYVYYTVQNKNVNRISRFQSNGDYAFPNSEKILLETEPISGYVHNAGAMAFGIDNKLYVSIGDMSQPGLAQNQLSLNGKVIRLNPDGSIPDDNPFYTTTEGVYRSIWALGFRNTFSLAIEPDSGTIFGGDVGLESWEEINEIVPGGNYGWNMVEGVADNQNLPDNYQDPIYAYENAWGVGCAVTGSAFYSPDNIIFPPEFHHRFFYSDYCNGEIRVLNEETGTSEVFASGIDKALSLLVGDDGSLYYVARGGIGGGSPEDNTSSHNGKLYKISYQGSGAPFISQQPQSQSVTVGDTVMMTLRAFGNDGLSYEWYRNNSKLGYANSDSLLLQGVDLSFDQSHIYCVVRNDLGEVRSQEAILTVVDNQRPIPIIKKPDVGDRYVAGDTLFFSGVASDSEDGDLSGESLNWIIDFHHENHIHPFASDLTGNQNWLILPETGETSPNVWYRIHLVAIDKHGFGTRVFRDIYPEIIDVTFESRPHGLLFNMDGNRAVTPFQMQSVQGIFHTVTALPIQVQNDKIFAFEVWENDSDLPYRTFTATEEGQLLVANFIEGNLGKGHGLKGQYYDDPGRDFSGELIFERVDSLIDFKWLSQKPSEDMPEDLFTIRWTGFVQVPFTDDYTFHIVSDDGVRLYLDNQLIIDRWQPQQVTEVSSSEIPLQKDLFYPITLEYREDYGEAICVLNWSSEYFFRDNIPSSQLYTTKPQISTEKNINIYPNPVREQMLIDMSCLTDEVTINIFDVSGKAIFQDKMLSQAQIISYEIDTKNFTPGLYLLRVSGCTETSQWVRFIKH